MPQDVNSLPTDSLAPAAMLHEQLAKGDLVSVLSVQCIRNSILVFAEEYRLVCVRDPSAYPLAKLRHRYRIAMPLVADELMVPLGEKIKNDSLASPDADWEASPETVV